MTLTPRLVLTKLLSFGIVGLCAWYLLRDVDLPLLLETLGGHPPELYVAACVLFLVTLLPMCLRLHVLMSGRCSLNAASRAVFFGSGANSILPARLGDVAKAAYLTRTSGIPTAATLCAVFWERLADLCVVLLLALLLGLRYEARFLYLPLMLAVGGVFLGLILVNRYPRWFRRMAALVPVHRMRDLLDDMIGLVADRSQWPSWPRLFALSVMVWGSFSVFNTVFLHFFFDMPLDIWTGMLVGVAGAIGMMVPAMPANIGTYEASVVAALILSGQDKSLALAAALLLHAVSVLPTAAFAAVTMIRGR
jgi:hypothetical protein